jgi:hypothetical protein
LTLAGRLAKLTRRVPCLPCVSLFFARVLLVFLYNRTGYSVLLVAIFHASFDAAISRLSYDVVPASNTARFLIFTGVIVAAAATVIIATKGHLGRRLDVVPLPEAGDVAGEHTPDDTAGKESDPQDT